MSTAASSAMDMIPVAHIVENVENSTEIKNKSNRPTRTWPLLQHSQPLIIELIDDISTVDSSETDSDVGNDGLDNLETSTETKNLDDAAVVPDRTDIDQVTILQTEDNIIWECDICMKIFFGKIYLDRHKLRHGEKKHKCEVCGKAFCIKQDLSHHMRMHTGEKPYMCAHCGLSFSDRAACTSHQRRHTGQKPYLCRICGKKFDSPNKLSMHKQTHNKDGYECSICKKRFTNTAGVQKHKRIVHFKNCANNKDVIQKYPCGICGKHFAKLEAHMRRIHPDGKPQAFTCTTCNKVYYSRNVWDYHMLSHKEKTFKCDICEKSFSRSCELEKHKYRHELDQKKKMPCAECGEFFIRRHPVFPWTILRCVKCKPKKKTTRCKKCKAYYKISKNHFCKTSEIKKAKELISRCKNCGELYKPGDVHRCFSKLYMHRKYVVDFKEICDDSEISCSICKRYIQNDQSKPVHCCKTLGEIGKIFQTVERLVSNAQEDMKSYSSLTKNVESAGMNKTNGLVPVESNACQSKHSESGIIQNKDTLKSKIGAVRKKKGGKGATGKKQNAKSSKGCRRVFEPSTHSLIDSIPFDEFTPPPQLPDAFGRWPKIVEIEEKGNTEDSYSGHLDILENEAMLTDNEKNGCDMMTVNGKNVARKFEDTIMQEIIHIMEEIEGTVC